MADTIRERIIQAISAKLGDIRTANGYNTDIGANVYRAAMTVPKASLPAISVIPGIEESAKNYAGQVSTMPVRILGLAEHDTSTNPSVLVEQMLGDLITCLLGIEYLVSFTGGNQEPTVGSLIIGQTSLATGQIIQVTVTSGSWAGGDAAGALRLRNQSGNFQAGENLDAVGFDDFAVAVSDSVAITPKENAGNNLVDEIAYVGGGTDDYPESIDITTTCTAVFHVRYHADLGNPYEQSS
jgi:hypothetical protein